jgi:hypothetical protein
VIKRIHVAGSNGFGDLALYKSRESTRLEPDELRAEIADDIGGAGEQQIPDKDRYGVPPAGVRAGGAATYGSLVHNVVVIEAGHVGQLNDYRRLYHVVGVGVRADVGAKDD